MQGFTNQTVVYAPFFRPSINGKVTKILAKNKQFFKRVSFWRSYTPLKMAVATAKSSLREVKILLS